MSFNSNPNRHKLNRYGIGNQLSFAYLEDRIRIIENYPKMQNIMKHILDEYAKLDKLVGGYEREIDDAYYNYKHLKKHVLKTLVMDKLYEISEDWNEERKEQLFTGVNDAFESYFSKADSDKKPVSLKLVDDIVAYIKKHTVERR